MSPRQPTPGTRPLLLAIVGLALIVAVVGLIMLWGRSRRVGTEAVSAPQTAAVQMDRAEEVKSVVPADLGGQLVARTLAPALESMGRPSAGTGPVARRRAPENGPISLPELPLPDPGFLPFAPDPLRRQQLPPYGVSGESLEPPVEWTATPTDRPLPAGPQVHLDTPDRGQTAVLPLLAQPRRNRAVTEITAEPLQTAIGAARMPSSASPPPFQRVTAPAGTSQRASPSAPKAPELLDPIAPPPPQRPLKSG